MNWPRIRFQTHFKLLFFIFFFSQILSCRSHKEKSNNQLQQSAKSEYLKPPSSYQDSLIINRASAVFYYPDSLQLLQIKALMDSSEYDGTMHEFFYQIRNSKIVIKKNYPNLNIIDVKHYRFLLFQNNNKLTEIIDLNKQNDAYGLFLFNQAKSPQLVDMTNIETALDTYFK